MDRASFVLLSASRCVDYAPHNSLEHLLALLAVVEVDVVGRLRSKPMGVDVSSSVEASGVGGRVVEASRILVRLLVEAAGVGGRVVEASRILVRRLVEAAEGG